MIRSSSSPEPAAHVTRVVAFALALLALLALSAISAPLAAQPSPAESAADDDQKRELAQKSYTDALERHKSGDFAGAAEGYLRANELYPRPLFLYNAAVVFRLGGEKEKALEHYKLYLELEPDGKGAASARKFVPILEKEIADRDAAATATGIGKETPDSTGQGDGSATETGLDSSKELDSSDPLPIVTRASLEAHGSSKRIAGLVTAGVGVALIGAGVGFGIRAKSLADEASEYQGPAGPELDDIYERGDAADRNMVVLVSAGALMAAAGGVIYYLGVRDRSRAERDLEIFVTPAGAGVSGRF